MTSGTPCTLCTTPTGDDTTVCLSCARQASHGLREVAEWLADDLDAAVAKQTTLAAASSEGKPTKKAEMPLPLDLRASEAATILRNILTTWVTVLRQHGATSHPGTTTKAIAKWLAPAILWNRHHTWAPNMVDELTTAYRQALAAADRPPELTYAGRCQTCGAPIYALGNRQAAQCRTEGCDGHVGDVAQARMTLLRLSGRQLVTAEQAARALTTAGRPITARWIRQLAATGQLTGIPAVRGPSRYLLGDILDVLAPKETAA